MATRVDVPSWIAFFRQLPGQPLSGYTQSLSRNQRCQLDALRRWTKAIADEGEFKLENEQWTHVLHDQHLGYQGAPPPRCLVDRPELYPGLRGGRQTAPEA